MKRCVIENRHVIPVRFWISVEMHVLRRMSDHVDIVVASSSLFSLAIVWVNETIENVRDLMAACSLHWTRKMDYAQWIARQSHFKTVLILFIPRNWWKYMWKVSIYLDFFLISSLFNLVRIHLIFFSVMSYENVRMDF